MRAKYLHFACLLVCVLMLLCGCGKGDEVSDSWQFNDTSHWHICDRADCTEQHDAASHQWDLGVIGQEATCEQAGHTLFTCTVCQATRTEEIACKSHTPAGEWKHDSSAHWYICQSCGRDFSQAAHKWYRATTSETGDDAEELYVCIICNLLTDEKPAVLEDLNAKPIYVGRIPSNIPTLGNGEYVFIPHMNGNNFTLESSTNANIGISRGEKTPFGKSVMIDVPVGAGLLTLKPESIMSREDIEKLVAEGNSEIVASFSIEITGGNWWGGPVKISTPWSGLSYSTDKYQDNKASLTVKFAAADLLANYDRICEEGLFVLDYANRNYDSFAFTMTPFEIAKNHELADQWEQDESDHYHTCKVCGAEKDRQAHTLTGRNCSVCGEVKSYLFNPKADGSNFRVSNTGNANISVYRGETELGSVAVIDVPQNANVITFTPNEILDKAKLEALQAEGITEVRAQLTTRITGGMWWAGSVKITTSWSEKGFLFADFNNNLLGPVTMKFSVQDVLDNYDKICQEGLFSFFFDNSAHDTYQISFSGFELVTDHEWIEGWQRDENHHFHICSICSGRVDETDHDWIDEVTCSVCGTATVLNNFTDLRGIKVTYLDPKGNPKESSINNRWITMEEDAVKAYISTWIRSNSLQLYMPLQLSKGEIKKLLDYGCTELTITIKQSYMLQEPWWGLTNNVSADWTTTQYSVKHSDGFKTLTFSLQDFYDHYDAIADGTMSLLRFSIPQLGVNEGGIWIDGYGWMTSDYNIWVKDVKVVYICKHTVGTQWQTDGTSHWYICTKCGERIQSGSHSFGSWVMDGNSHYKACQTCGYITAMAEHSIGDAWSQDNIKHWHGCAQCSYKQDEVAHSWQEVPGGKECTVCGYEDVLYFVFNDFTNTAGIKMTYQNPGDTVLESTFDNSGISMDGEAMKINIPMWTKPKTLQLYMPLNTTKDNVKKLLDAGYTEFTVTVKQSMMNQASQSTLTNTVSAGWTDATYTVTYAEGFKMLHFSLQDLYNNYDAIASGSIALLQFSIAELGAAQGGILVPGQGMVSTDYDIWIKDIQVIPIEP